jgi:DNA-binding MarR family transcriptional regulator
MTEPMSTVSRAELVRRLVATVRRQVAWTVLHNQALADRLGMGLTDLHCVNLLDLEGPMTAGRLAGLMGLTTGAVTGVLDRLEGSGLVQREADPADRRRVVARLVPDGMERVRAAYAAVGAGTHELYSSYDESQLELLIDYAQRSLEITRRLTSEMRARVAVPREGGASAPLAEVSAGRLELSSSAANLSVRTDSRMADLYRASFPKGMPRIRVSGGTVTMTFPAVWRGGAGRGEIILNARIPWAIDIRGGVANLEVDLSGAAGVTALSMAGGASRVDLVLARPVGSTLLRIRGGASRVTIRRPRAVPVRVRVSGGLSKVTVDGRSFGSSAGGTALDTPGYENAVDRYELVVDGGASRITVEPR